MGVVNTSSNSARRAGRTSRLDMAWSWAPSGPANPCQVTRWPFLQNDMSNEPKSQRIGPKVASQPVPKHNVKAIEG